MKDCALFPVVSLIAVLSVGALYATVTSLPAPIAAEKVSSTVSPTNAIPVGTTGEPSTVTAKADGEVPDPTTASLNLSVIFNPVDEMTGTGVVSDGPFVSSVELFWVTVRSAKEGASIPFVA